MKKNAYQNPLSVITSSNIKKQFYKLSRNMIQHYQSTQLKFSSHIAVFSLYIILTGYCSRKKIFIKYNFGLVTSLHLTPTPEK